MQLTNEQLNELRRYGLKHDRQDIVDAADLAILRSTQRDYRLAETLYDEHVRHRDGGLTSPDLTERDRLMIYEVIRRYMAQDIERRGIAKTYTAGALSLSAYDLHAFVEELLSCCTGDAVSLASQVAADIAGIVNEGGLQGSVFVAGEVSDALPELPALDTLERASAREVAAERATYE